MRRIASDSPYESKIGYTRAVVAGDFVFVSGTSGLHEDGTGGSVTEQCEIALSRIARALGEAQASYADVVRVTYILPDRDDFPSCWPVLRQTFGDAPPAATMLEARLIDPAMKIEIEVTAFVPR